MNRPWPGTLAIGTAVAAVLGLVWLSLQVTSDARSPGEDPPRAESEAREVEAPRASALPGPPSTPADMRDVVRSSRTAGRHAAADLRARALGPDALVAGNALRALGALDLVAGDAELVALLDDRRPRVRQEVVIALGASGREAAVDPIAARLTDADATLRPLMIQALGRLPGERARSLVAAIAADASASETDRAFARSAVAAR